MEFMQGIIITFIICAAIVFIIAAMLNRQCRHNYELQKEEKIDIYDGHDKITPIAFQMTYFYVCRKCGMHNIEKLRY